jgi:hypothetical protein
VEVRYACHYDRMRCCIVHWCLTSWKSRRSPEPAIVTT